MWDEYGPDFKNLDFHSPLRSRLLKMVTPRIYEDGMRGVFRPRPTLQPWSYTTTKAYDHSACSSEEFEVKL